MVSSITALQGLYVALGGELSDVADITTIPDMLEAISTVASAAASELPPVKPADNGKVLSVVEGKWNKADLPKELPAVTAEENGKVLMVVEGEWGLGSVPQYYTVSYNLNGGTGTTPLDQEVRAGSSITVASASNDITPPPGFVGFLTWCTDPTDPNHSSVSAGSTYTPSGDTVLYALYWQEI